MTEKETPTSYIQRPEFEVLRQEVRSIEKNLTRLDVVVQQLFAQGQEQNSRLLEIAEMLQRQEDTLDSRDRAMRKMIWAANTLGPKAVALGALLVSLLYEWLKRR